MISPIDFCFNYAVVRHLQPKRVIEIGSGFSTSALARAVASNGVGEVTCIEPFRAAAIDPSLRVKVIPEIVQRVNESLFATLEPGDILYIDSSHVFAPFGDTLLEFVFLLPKLPPGVWVHIHDIFLPQQYPRQWTIERNYMEQWVLALFLHGNNEWEIRFPINYVLSQFPERFASFQPTLSAGSFWIQRKTTIS